MFASAAGPLAVTLPESGLLVAESRHGPEFSMELQEHPFHEVLLLLRGRLVADIPSAESTPVALDPGDCLILPAGTTHRLRDDRGSTLVVVAFTPDFLGQCPMRRELWQQIVDRSAGAVIRRSSEGERNAPWREMIARQVAPDAGGGAPARDAPARVVELHSAFNAFLLQLDRSRDNPLPADALERVSRFVHQLGRRAHEPWTLDSAAAANALSRRRFSELFRQVTGESLITHLQRRRVEAVQTLLAGGAYSIAGAAYASGFEDLAHFYRVFRRHAGITPGAWLAAAAEDATGGYPSGAAGRERG